MSKTTPTGRKATKLPIQEIKQPHPLREQFLDAIAGYLVDNVALKSMAVPTSPLAAEWARVRNVSGLFGYPPKAEARAHIMRVLGIDA